MPPWRGAGDRCRDADVLVDRAAPFFAEAGQLSPVGHESRAHFRTLSGWLTSVLDRGVKQGTIVLSGSARAEAEAFMATMHGAMLSARAYGEPTILEAIAKPLIDRLVAPQ